MSRILALAVVAGCWLVPLSATVGAAPSDYEATLVQGFFTTTVTDRRPGAELSEFRLGSGPRDLWFYSIVTCAGSCADDLRDAGSVELVHYWYYWIGAGWEQEDVIRTDMTQLPSSESGWRFPSRKRNLRPGRYRVKVSANGQDVCYDNGECELTITVE